MVCWLLGAGTPRPGPFTNGPYAFCDGEGWVPRVRKMTRGARW